VRLLTALALAAPLFAGTAFAGSPSAVPAGAPFEARAPKGWRSAATEAGLVMTGPAGEAGLRPLISLRWYAPGDRYFPDLESFVRRQTEPGPFKSTTPAAVSAVLVAGRKATRIERQGSEFVPPRAVGSKEIAVRERAVAVPAASGFYVLSVRAPRSADKAAAKAFDAVLASFKPRR